MWSEPFPRGSAESKKMVSEDQFDSSTEGHGRCCHGRRSIEAGLGHPAIFISTIFFWLQKNNESTYRPYPFVCLVGDVFCFYHGIHHHHEIHHQLGEYVWNFFPSIEESQIKYSNLEILEDSIFFRLDFFAPTFGAMEIILKSTT